MKKINLRELPITNIEGKEEKMDISKEVIDAVLSNQGIYTKYKANGENKFGSVTNVGNTGYVVISSITSSEYFREIY